ncbi:MAG: hotdog fold domain-containing protein [Lysobacteraceae bacterium]
MADGGLLALYRRLQRWPAGGWLFSRAVCFRAPYFRSIRPRIVELDAGRCVVEFDDRRSVRNHLGSVHAIALCNAAELAAGLCSDVSLPASMRWIPKGMDVQYLAKAHGRMRASAQPAIAAVDAAQPYELPVEVDVVDPKGVVVFHARVRMWVSPKPAR